MKEAQRFSLQRLLNKSFCKDGSAKGKEKGEIACSLTHHPPSHRTRVSLKNYWPPSSSSTCPSETSVRWSHSWRRTYTCAWINLRQQQSTTNILAEIPRPVWLYFSALDSGWKSSGIWRRAGAGDPGGCEHLTPDPLRYSWRKTPSFLCLWAKPETLSRLRVKKLRQVSAVDRKLVDICKIKVESSCGSRGRKGSKVWWRIA